MKKIKVQIILSIVTILFVATLIYMLFGSILEQNVSAEYSPSDVIPFIVDPQIAVYDDRDIVNGKAFKNNPLNPPYNSYLVDWFEAFEADSHRTPWPWIPQHDSVYCIEKGMGVLWIKQASEGEGDISDDVEAENNPDYSNDGESNDEIQDYIKQMHMSYSTMFSGKYNEEDELSKTYTNRCSTCNSDGCHKNRYVDNDLYYNTFYVDVSGSKQYVNARYTNPIYIASTSMSQLDPIVAYIVSKANKMDDSRNWSDQIQLEIWGLRGTEYNPSWLTGNVYGKLAADSIAYAKFHEEVNEDDFGLKPENRTKFEDVEILVDQSTAEYTIHNLSIDYLNGQKSEYAFAGIENIFLIGFDANGAAIEEQSNIGIKGLVLYEDEEATVGVYYPKSDLRFWDSTYFESEEKGEWNWKVDVTAEQLYPQPQQKFDIVFSNPNIDPNTGEPKESGDPTIVDYVEIQVDFQFMQAQGMIRSIDGSYYKLEGDDSHKSTSSTRYCTDEECEDPEICTFKYTITEVDIQNIASFAANRCVYRQSLRIATEQDIRFDLTMNLGGKVWEDVAEEKGDLSDGILTESDILLPNVKVTLYEEDGTLVEIQRDFNEILEDGTTIYNYMNPTLTDENGEYLFVGLDSMKKYYVVFEYNGQTYMPTDHFANGMANWAINSKATEFENTFNNKDNVSEGRTEYDKRFEEIGSAPENYVTTESFGISSNGKNESFTQLELMGYRLEEDGEYKYYKSLQIVDGFLYEQNDEVGMIETSEYSEGLITTNLHAFIEEYKRYPTDEEMNMYVYEPLILAAVDNDEMRRIIQFIEDRNMDAITVEKFGDSTPKTYPIYEKFYIEEEYELDKERKEESSPVSTPRGTYYPIYPKQLQINLGLWRRQEADFALVKDLFKVTVKINEKTVIYDYDARSNRDEDGNELDQFDIHLRLQDYDSYYGLIYDREIFETDYEYKSGFEIATSTDENGKPLTTEIYNGEELDIYATYKIRVRNQSQTIEGIITEIVDYYDSEYEYIKELSWIMYDKESTSEDESELDLDKYYEMMEAAGTDSFPERPSTWMDAVGSSDSKYPTATTDIDNTNAVYVTGQDKIQLQSGETLDIYLTFKVNKDENDNVILDEIDGEDQGNKVNHVEINGFETYYRDETSLPNGVSKDSSDIAGLLDKDSTPGNLTNQDVGNMNNEKFEMFYEDDTDRAIGLNIKLYEDATRELNGLVFEDERNLDIKDSIIGDGILDDGELKVANARVQLVELIYDDNEKLVKEYIWKQAVTGTDGYYEFLDYIPGDYIVRFYYGQSDEMIYESEVSYNGQDFKSTTYQVDVEQTEYTDLSERFNGYTNVTNQNTTGSYGYNIYEADTNQNVSDAKDVWERRLTVNAYSDTEVTNSIAEELALNEKGNFRKNTYMIAETGVIAVEVEYDRQTSDSSSETKNDADTSSRDDYSLENAYNGNYILGNVDLGITERPKAQLEIDKEVENVKLILANQSILFDVIEAEAVTNVIWLGNIPYNSYLMKIDSSNNNIFSEGDEISSEGMFDEYYGKSNDNGDSDRYALRPEVDTLVKSNTDNGLIQLTMDEELMHGATVEISYNIKLTNVGEVDYKGENFYYTGNTSGTSIVETKADSVIDYVANNLKFDASTDVNKQYWTVVENIEELDLNNDVIDNIEDLNTLIVTENLNNWLQPGQSSDEIKLVLTQLITAENETDDLTYENAAEIISTSNTVGRRMAYSIVGNHDPYSDSDDTLELDTSYAEKVIIIPPFGEYQLQDEMLIFVVAILVGLTLAGGIVFIKKKVIGKAE